MKKVLCVLVSVAMLLQVGGVFAQDVVLPQSPAAQEQPAYDWGILPIGAGGFITGMVFSPVEAGLIFARTDVGGAYRFDPTTKKWTNMSDVFTWNEWSFYGTDGIAVDPKNPDVVYMAAGKYTYATGDVLKSTDRGQTWNRTNLNKAFGGNESNRGMGEPIMVDPNNSNIIYCGTIQDGLWKSEDAAKTWSKVSAIEVAADKTNAIRNIVFDKTTALKGVTQTIYAGVINKGIYRSQDAGKTWSLLPNSPKTAKRMDVGNNGTLVVASTSGLFRFANETFTEISPEGMSGGVFNGVSLDPKDENIIVCVGPDPNVMKLPMYYSKNGGVTWENKWATAKHTPSLAWNENDDTFSSNTHCILFNPHDTKQVWFSDWHSIYMTANIEATPTQKWEHMINGIEEMVPFDLACPPVGKYRLFTALADNDGMPYTNIDQFPTRKLTSKETRILPWMMSTTQIDFCETAPNIVFRVGVDWNMHGKVELSTDSSETWKFIQNLPLDEKGNAKPIGRAAISAQKHPETGNPVLMMIPVAGATVVSYDMGDSWVESKGLEDAGNIVSAFWTRNLALAADRVDGSKFYILKNNQVYVSNDWGASFEKTATLPGPDGRMILKAAPYKAGDVWAACYDDGLYHSVDGGKTFNKMDQVVAAESIGFGKEAPGSNNATMFLFGTINYEKGVFRSIDNGETWQKISNESATLGCMPNVMEGDRQTFGVVYLGSDGRGFYVGRPTGVDMTPEKPVTKLSAALTYNTKPMAFANAPTILSGTMMVPLREFAEYFGAKVTWDEQANVARVTRDELQVNVYGTVASSNIVKHTVSVAIGSYYMDADGVEVFAKQGAILFHDRMYVSLVGLAQAFGATATWNANMDACSILDPMLVQR